MLYKFNTEKKTNLETLIRCTRQLTMLI